MIFDQMKRRGWVVIDDNPDNPIEVSDTLMGEWINEAVQDLAESLHVLKTQNLTVNQGAAWLPDDYLEAIKVFDGDKELNRLFSLFDKTVTDDTTDAVECFTPNDGTIRIYGTKLNDSLILQYKSLPEQLSNKADTPESIPSRYHHFIPEVYVKAQYALKNGRTNTYRMYMALWEDIRREITSSQGVTSFEQEATW